MNNALSRLWIVRLLAFTLFVAAIASAVTPAMAQQATPFTPLPRDDRGFAPHPVPEQPGQMTAAEAAAIPPLGAPGLSFRYVQTFGETKTAYFEDSNHLNHPVGLTTDGANVWVTEYDGRRALKYTSSGQYVMQIGKAGLHDAEATTMVRLADVAVDGSGNIWFVDEDVHQVFKFDAEGNFKSALGKRWNVGAANDLFVHPVSIAFDSAGRIYVSDGSPTWSMSVGNHRIQVFNADGSYLTTIGQTGNPGPGDLQFNGQRRITIFGNLLYVADTGNHRVQILNIANPLAPVHVATIGLTGDAYYDNEHLGAPSGVAVNANYIYVADTWYNRVQVFNQATLAYVGTIGNAYGPGNDQFNQPMDVAVDAAGNLYVADYNNARVQQFDANRQYVRTLGTTGVPYTTDASHFFQPRGVAVAKDGAIYITEDGGNRLVKLTAGGQPLWTVGVAGVPGGWDGANDRLSAPDGVSLDGSGRVFVADKYSHRIQVFTTGGAYVRTLGTAGELGTDNNHFSAPRGVHFGLDNRLYVADTDNHRIQIFDANLNYVATMGVTGQSGADNAHFNGPHDVAVDANGNIYVADSWNRRIQIFDANRTYVRTIGVTGQQGRDFAHFNEPARLAVDAERRLYVADGWNNRLQVFDANGAYLTTIGGTEFGSARTGDLHGTFGVAVDGDGNVYVPDAWDSHRVQKFAPGVPNWVQRNINGFGNPYVRDILVLSVFNNTLYAGTAQWDGSGALRIMRSTDGRQWSEVMGSNVGSPYDYAVNSLQVFKGKLYAGLENWNWTQNRSEGGSVWRSDDGSSWTQVVTNGFGDPDQATVDSMAVFKDQLYATTAPAVTSKGPEIWRSVNADGSNWQRVVSNGFGDVNNRFIPAFKVFGDHLYAATYNEISGGQLWRTADGVDWQPISEDGLGNGSNSAISSLEVFNNVLYAGTRNLMQGEEIWRSTDGVDWTQVVSGGLDGQKHRGAYALTSADGYLYAFVYSLAEEALQAQVWRTADGATWQPVSIPGWGDVNNAGSGYDGISAQFNGSLYYGTANQANGAELWQFTPDRVSVTIADPAVGATLSYTNTQSGATLQVIVPSDAVTETTTLVYETTPLVSPPSGWKAVVAPFDLAAYRNEAKLSGFTFAKPVTFVFQYAADVGLIDSETITLLHWNNGTQQWEDAACGAVVREPAQRTISVPVCSLSQFVLVAEPGIANVYLPLVQR